MFGLPELIVVVVLCVFVLGPVIAAFYCRRHYPGRLWIGITLCLFNGAIGQLYLPGGTLFFLLGLVLYVLTANWSGYGWLAVTLLSAAVMWWRHRRHQEKPSLTASHQ